MSFCCIDLCAYSCLSEVCSTLYQCPSWTLWILFSCSLFRELQREGFVRLSFLHPIPSALSGGCLLGHFFSLMRSSGAPLNQWLTGGGAGLGEGVGKLHGLTYPLQGRTWSAWSYLVRTLCSASLPPLPCPPPGSLTGVPWSPSSTNHLHIKPSSQGLLLGSSI